MTDNIEVLIISGLLYSEQYKKSIISYIPETMFEDQNLKEIFKLISNYDLKYNEVPCKEAIQIELKNNKLISESIYQNCKNIIEEIYSESTKSSIQNINSGWLLTETEKYCKQRAIYNAILESLEIIDGNNKKLTQDAIPDLLSKALGTSFNKSVGHDYFEDLTKRFEYYHKKEKKIKFHLEMLNYVTKGGLERKTLNCIMAPTGVGKTFFMTDCAANHLKEGYNVLYISLEMAEERIAERIDACLLDVTLDDLKCIPENTYKSKLNKLKNSTIGKLIIKEYPPGVLSVSNIKNLIEELKTKKNFTPDIIYIDYINLMASTRLKSIEQMYNYIKAIAEELRGFAVIGDYCVITATQTNRAGAGKTDYDSTETSESYGLPMTLDLFIGLISTPEMEELNQMRMKLIAKNRYGSLTDPSSWIVGINRSKMQFFDVDKPTIKKQNNDNMSGMSNQLTNKPNGNSSKVSSFKF